MAWLPEGKLFPDYGSTDDETLDGELIDLEDLGEQPLETIQAVCKKYRVHARLFQPLGYFIGTIAPDGGFTAAA